MKNRLLRFLALCLALLLLCPTLLACAKENPTELDATEVIGKVGEFDVTYDELYFLLKTYEDTFAEQYEGDPEGLAEALDELAREELITNAAYRLLCEQYDLKYSESKLRSEVNEKITEMIRSNHEGDEEAFRASMAENGISEHYLRYTTGLEILYGKLMSVYPEEGLVVSSTPALKAYIMENFICTYHIALFNESPDEDAENLAKMTEARNMLTSGSATMYQIIRGYKTVGGEKIPLKGYNEDISDPAGDGNYLTRGTWNEEYEEAAFDLEVGEISQVVKVNQSSRSVPAYYVIQRAPLDEEYVEKNLSTLQDEYYASVIYSDLQEVRKELSFEPNELYESLDLTDPLPLVEKDNTVLIIVLCSVGGVLLLGGGITGFLLKKRKKKKETKA